MLGWLKIVVPPKLKQKNEFLLPLYLKIHYSGQSTILVYAVTLLAFFCRNLLYVKGTCILGA